MRPPKQSRYASQRQVPSMATPRRPEPPNKAGFPGVIILMFVFGGIIWLMMLIFGMGPYATEVGEVTPTVTETQIPVLSDRPTDIVTTPFVSTPTKTPEPTMAQTPTTELLPFILFGEPESMSSVLFRQELGCDWLVIAGQVWDLQDKPVTGLTLHLFGELAGFSIDRYVLTGSAPAYGESGYEFALEGMVADSKDSLFIQLVDADGLPLSIPYSIETFNDCLRSRIVVNFKKVR